MGRKVAEVMSKGLETVELTTTLAEASSHMKDKRIRHLLIVDRATGNLLGMLSDRDVKKFLSPFIGSARETSQDKATATIEVGKVMIPKDRLISAKPEDDLKSTLEKMLIKKIGSVPVVETSGRAVGIVTRGDMLKLLMSFL